MTANNTFTTVTQNGNLDTNGANSVGLFNQGNVTAVINSGLKIPPGESRSISQVLPNIVDTTTYSVYFNLNAPDTTGTTKELLVITTIITQ